MVDRFSDFVQVMCVGARKREGRGLELACIIKGSRTPALMK